MIAHVFLGREGEKNALRDMKKQKTNVRLSFHSRNTGNATSFKINFDPTHATKEESFMNTLK